MNGNGLRIHVYDRNDILRISRVLSDLRAQNCGRYRQRNMLSCYMSPSPSACNQSRLSFQYQNHVVAVPCFRLQDRAVSRSFLFVVLVSDAELNGHLKHFVDSVVLFGRALDILCSH